MSETILNLLSKGNDFSGPTTFTGTTSTSSPSSTMSQTNSNLPSKGNDFRGPTTFGTTTTSGPSSAMSKTNFNLPSKNYDFSGPTTFTGTTTACGPFTSSHPQVYTSLHPQVSHDFGGGHSASLASHVTTASNLASNPHVAGTAAYSYSTDLGGGTLSANASSSFAKGSKPNNFVGLGWKVKF